MCRKEWNQPSKVLYLLAGGLDFWHMIFRLFYRCAVREWVLLYRTRGAQGTYVFYMYEYARRLINSTRRGRVSRVTPPATKIYVVVLYMYEYARSLSNSTRLWDGAGEPGHAACN
jgi:hypothetical protein